MFLQGLCLFLLAMLILTLYRSCGRKLELESMCGSLPEKNDVLLRMQTGILKAAEAEKDAIIADTDEESQAFALQSREAVAAVDESRARLGTLSQSANLPEEQRLVLEFDACWGEFKELNHTLLDYAVQNTNLKATRLSTTAGRDALRRFQTNLAVLIELSARGRSGQTIAQAAFNALSAAFEIYFLEAPHIIASSDEKMDEIESAMSGGHLLVNNSLLKIRELLGSTDPAPLEAAMTAFTDFLAVNEEVVRLSRRNTNIKSMELSRDPRRKNTARCEDVLNSLVALARPKDLKTVR